MFMLQHSKSYICLSLAVTKASTNEQELINYLFEHYKPEVRPVVKDSDAVDVTLGLTISQVIDVVCRRVYFINICIVSN